MVNCTDWKLSIGKIFKSIPHPIYYIDTRYVEWSLIISKLAKVAKLTANLLLLTLFSF